MNFGGKQGFIGVHIADAGDESLVEKYGFYRSLVFVQPFSQNLHCEIRSQRLRAEFAGNGSVIFQQPQRSQTSAVCKNELRTIVKVKDNSGITVSFTWVEKQGAGHLEVDNQRVTS